MSSFDGSNLSTQASTDPGLQEAPRGDDGPDHSTLKKSFSDTVLSLQPYIDQTRENFDTRFARWANQSSDGRKHKREGDKIDPTPWEGASDLRVYLVDEAINAKVALLCSAFDAANVGATPVEGNDLARAKTVGNFLKWTANTQIPELDREAELLANYIQEKGIGATGQFWQTTQEKTLMTITTQQLAKQFPQLDIVTLLASEDEEAKGLLMSLCEEVYGASKQKAAKAWKELRATGKSTIAIVGKEMSYPVIRAFNLDEDLLIPAFSTDIESAPRIFRIQYFTAEQLRAFVRTDEWDEAWVEAAIETLRGKMLENYQYEIGQMRSFIYQQFQPFTDLIGVVYAYQRLSDEDGVPGIYLTIFNPDLPPEPKKHDGYAKHGLLGYTHGKYPFVIHRREFLSRRLHDSRGLAEPGRPLQDQIKVHSDSRVDAASIAICPPMGYPVGRPPTRWGANARIAERRPGEVHYLDRPRQDPLTDTSQALLADSFNRYNGFVARDADVQFAALKNKREVKKFLSGWSAAFRQVWKLYQQFGRDEVYFRVIGMKSADPVLMTKGDPTEDYDITLTFDIDSTDWQKQEQKLEAMAKVLATFDKYGQADTAEAFQIAMEVIDPNWAERVVTPKEVGGQKIINETHTMLAQVFSGVDRDIDLSSPPELMQQVLQQYGQAPDVQQRYAQDPAFKARIDKIGKQIQQQIVQKKNAVIGRYGA